jgi:hypothetical protein
MGTDITRIAERRMDGRWEHCPVDFYCGEERNYALFAILAGVRRLTNGGFEPIVPPRDLPPDMSVSGWTGPDGHNETWLTLRELLDFPRGTRMYPVDGSVRADQYLVFKAEGRPHALWQGSGRLLSNEEMERRIAEGTEEEDHFTRIAFGIPYAEFAGPFVTEALPLLQALGPADDVRLVLWFDS